MPVPVWPEVVLGCVWGLVVKSTYAIAVAIAVVLLLWLGSGQFSAGQPDEGVVADSAEESVKKAPRVRTEISRAELFVAQVSASGSTQAKRSVQVKAETSGLLTLVVTPLMLTLPSRFLTIKQQLLAKLSGSEPATTNPG